MKEITSINSYVLLTKLDFKEHPYFKESEVMIPFEILDKSVKKGDIVLFRKGAQPTLLIMPDGSEALRLERLSIFAILEK